MKRPNQNPARECRAQLWRAGFRFTAPVLIAVVIGTIVWVNAGDLNPPAGPVSSTMKTLSEIEPRIAINATNTPGDANSAFRITQPGSYYLTGNLFALSNSCIEIAANNVTIDLMGHNIQALINAISGITVDGTRNNLTIRNGSVTGFPQGGVVIRGNIAGTGMLVEQILASNNAGGGISVGLNSVVRDCIASNNGAGIFTESGCTVTNCSAKDNAGAGIEVSFGCTITPPTADSAYSNTTDGIAVASDAAIANCTSLSNTRHGFNIGPDSTMSNCSANNNTGNGINTNNNSGCIITGCSAKGNTGDGINAGGCTVSNCTANENTGNGISIGFVTGGGLVTDCFASRNNLDGIRCVNAGIIRGNPPTADLFNGNLGDGAGIHATGADNRIEGNPPTADTSADRGIDVDNPGNFITRNTCSGNTVNWDVATSNKCLVVLGVNAAAFTGDSGGTAPGSTDPNANFTY